EPVFPRGIQPVESCREGEGESAEGTTDMSASTWELDVEEAAYAMHAGISEAKALEPRTVEEAWKQADWPRWDEAIKAELKSLDEAHTWDVIPRP
ncbi:hypothetical protein PAXINDRAFT_39319, partial [Paxillus involutus ATCC 200175]